jgi:hypothetical protein
MQRISINILLCNAIYNFGYFLNRILLDTTRTKYINIIYNHRNKDYCAQRYISIFLYIRKGKKNDYVFHCGLTKLYNILV